MKVLEIAAILMSGNHLLSPSDACDKAEALIAEVIKREKAEQEKPQEVV